MSGAFRCQVRLQLSDLDRGVYGQRSIVMAQSPEEPDEHILLRFLSHVLFFDEALADAHGYTDPHEPDLHALDLTGQLTLWVECGMPPMKRLTRALGKWKDARFVVLVAGRDEALAVRAQIVAQKPRNLERLEIHCIPQEFMVWLESVGSRSMEWNATISEHTLYLDSDGQQGEADIAQLPVLSRFDSSAVH